MAQNRTWHIAVIPSDGIGQEVIREGLRVLDYLAETSAHTFSFTYETFLRFLSMPHRKG